MNAYDIESIISMLENWSGGNADALQSIEMILK